MRHLVLKKYDANSENRIEDEFVNKNNLCEYSSEYSNDIRYYIVIFF